MAHILFLLLIIECLFILIWSFQKPDRLYYPPGWFIITILAIILPQVIGAFKIVGFPPGSFEKALLMIILCIGMFFLGFLKTVKPSALLAKYDNDEVFRIIGISFSFVGAYFFWKISRLPPELNTMGQWFGIVVIYNFFANSLIYGFAFTLVSFLKCRDRLSLYIVLFDSFFLLDRIVIAGRRSTALSVFLILLVSLWFYRGFAVKRIFLIIAIIVGVLWVNSIGEYRKYSTGGKGYESILIGKRLGFLTNITRIDFWGNMKALCLKSGPEFTKAVYDIANIDNALAFDYGLIHWNGIVQSFFPGQLFGYSTKASLLVHIGGYEQRYPYESATGTSSMGITDAFHSFWYFGCVKYFLIGWIMKKLYICGINGSNYCMVFYSVLLSSSLVIVSHPTQFFLSHLLTGVIYMCFAISIVSLFYNSKCDFVPSMGEG